MARRVIGTATVTVDADVAQFRNALTGMEATFSRTRSQVRGLGTEGENSGSRFRKAWGTAASGVKGTLSGLGRLVAGLGLAHLAREAITFGAEYRVQLDNARAAVIGLTDSTAEAEDLLQRMTSYAIRTPFDLPGVQNATTQMLAYGESFGVTSDNVLDYVNTLGNAAAATGKGTDSMLNVITVLGKISGQGRVMTRDMNALTANFPSLHPWEVLSEVTGVSVKELRKLSIQPGGLASIVNATDYIDALMVAMEDLPGASANWEALSNATGKTVEELKALSDEDKFALFRQFPDMADAMTRRMFTLGGSFEFFKDSMGVALADGLVPFFATLQGVMSDPAIMAALETLIKTFADLASQILSSIGPMLPSLINSFQQILAALMPIAPAIGDMVFMFAMALVTLAPTINLLAQATSWITKMLMKLDPTILGAISVALLVFWAALTGGVGPLIAIIIGLVVALVTLIVNNWDTIARVTGEMVAKVVELWDSLFESVIGPVRDFIMAIVDFFFMLWDTLVGNSIIPDMVEAIIKWFGILFDAVIAVVEAIKNLVIAIWNAIKTAVVTVVTAVVNFVKNHWQLLISIIGGPLGLIVALVVSNWNTIKSFISSTINTIKSTVTTVWNAIKTAIVTPIQSARDLAQAAVQAVLDKVRSAWSGIVGFVSGVWDGVKSAITGPIQAAYDFVADKVNSIKNLVQGAIDKVKSIPGAGIVGGVLGKLFADGGIVTRPTVGIVGEAGREAVIPLSNPLRAMQLMQQSGLDRLAAQMGGSRFSGPLVSMPGAIIQDATDADLVAQRTLVAMQAAMV